LVYQKYFGKPKVLVEAMSATKSIVNKAMGILLDCKFVNSIDQPVYTLPRVETRQQKVYYYQAPYRTYFRNAKCC